MAAFAINDQGTFTTAGRVLRRLRDHLGIDRPITLVGNKADLVRQRHVAHKGDDSNGDGDDDDDDDDDNEYNDNVMKKFNSFFVIIIMTITRIKII